MKSALYPIKEIINQFRINLWYFGWVSQTYISWDMIWWTISFISNPFIDKGPSNPFIHVFIRVFHDSWIYSGLKTYVSIILGNGLFNENHNFSLHHNDVIMRAKASQITSRTIVYSTFYSGADQRKHQSTASLAFVRGIHRSPVNSPHKWPATRKMFPFDDVIMYLEQSNAGWRSAKIVNPHTFKLLRRFAHTKAYHEHDESLGVQ